MLPAQYYVMKPGFPFPRARLTQGQARMMRVLEFLVRVCVLALPLYLVMWLGLDLYPIQLAVASQSDWILQAMGYQVARDGAGLTANGFGFFIIPDCTGWKSMLFLFALVLAVPGVSLRKRAWGIALGLPLVWLGNLARVVGVVAAQGAWGTDAALVIHDWLFQAGLVALVLGIWTAWLMWVKGIGLPRASLRRL